MAINAKVHWGGKKPHIIYRPPKTLTKIHTQFQVVILSKSYHILINSITKKREKRIYKL